jgi:hypothetical protein
VEANKPITVERTGRAFSLASSEFRVTYPDGHVGTLWSPPWHEMTDSEEEAEALRVATEKWRDGTYRE